MRDLLCSRYNLASAPGCKTVLMMNLGHVVLPLPTITSMNAIRNLLICNLRTDDVAESDERLLNKLKF